MRVAISKLTGKLIEAQSGGETHPDPKIDNKKYAQANLDTLQRNAINAGYKKEDIEVKFVTDGEYQALLKAVPEPEPTEEQIVEGKIQAKMRELAIEELKKTGELSVDYR